MTWADMRLVLGVLVVGSLVVGFIAGFIDAWREQRKGVRSA